MSEEDRSSGEGTEGYKKGGYHAVRIGDEFNNGEYVVQKKLGWGRCSTVWLAWDTRRSRYVALKIQKASEFCAGAATNEIRILKEIATKDPDDTKCVVKLLDHFKHYGPNGEHVCMVFECLGDHLRTLIKYSDQGIPLHMVKQICFHVLVGLDCLHHKLSIIHADLKPESILLLSMIDPSKDPTKTGAPLFPPTSKDPLLRAWMANQAFKNSEEDSKMRSHSVKEESDSYWQKLLTELDLRCKLADFGKACRINRHVSHNIQTRPYNCPEVILGSAYSTPADLWSFACICFELATGCALFDLQNGDVNGVEENHLTFMMELLGMMPREIALGGLRSWQFFNENGELKHIQGLQSRPLDRLLKEIYKFSEKDADEMAGFLVPILDFDPKKRPSAAQLLGHSWFEAGPRIREPSTSTSEEKKGKRKRNAMDGASEDGEESNPNENASEVHD